MIYHLPRSLELDGKRMKSQRFNICTTHPGIVVLPWKCKWGVHSNQHLEALKLKYCPEPKVKTQRGPIKASILVEFTIMRAYSELSSISQAEPLTRSTICEVG